MLITLVLGVTTLLTLSKVTCKLASKGMYLITAPTFLASLNHGNTLLACSALVITISSPGSKSFSKKPVAIMLSPSVAPDVNTTSSVSAPINSAIFFLAFSNSTSTL